MKVFDKEENFGSKVNFVDANNVMVGYDLSQDCCENAEWYIAKAPTAQSVFDISGEVNLDPYVFDLGYSGPDLSGVADYEQHIVVFRLNAQGKEDLFLHLSNTHNGYYSHGYDIAVDGDVKQSGYL